MTPTPAITSLPDFATLFHQIVGETIFGLNEFTPEEIMSLGLVQVEKEEQLLLEVLQTTSPVCEPNSSSHPWESLMRKLSQTI